MALGPEFLPAPLLVEPPTMPANSMSQANRCQETTWTGQGLFLQCLRCFDRLTSLYARVPLMPVFGRRPRGNKASNLR